MGVFLNQPKWDPKTVLTTTATWVWLKIKGFGPFFHLPGFHFYFGTGFLSHSHMKKHHAKAMRAPDTPLELAGLHDPESLVGLLSPKWVRLLLRATSFCGLKGTPGKGPIFGRGLPKRRPPKKRHPNGWVSFGFPLKPRPHIRPPEFLASHSPTKARRKNRPQVHLALPARKRLSFVRGSNGNPRQAHRLAECRGTKTVNAPSSGNLCCTASCHARRNLETRLLAGFHC